MGYESLHIMELLSVQCLQGDNMIPTVVLVGVVLKSVPLTVSEILGSKLKKTKKKKKICILCSQKIITESESVKHNFGMFSIIGQDLIRPYYTKYCCTL